MLKFNDFINENNNKKIDFDILETLTENELENTNFKHLNKDFLGWISIDILRDYLFHITRWKSNQIFEYDQIYWSNVNRQYLTQTYDMRRCSNIHKIRINGIKKKESNPNDPYDEENWD